MLRSGQDQHATAIGKGVATLKGGKDTPHKPASISQENPKFVSHESLDIPSIMFYIYVTNIQYISVNLLRVPCFLPSRSPLSKPNSTDSRTNRNTIIRHSPRQYMFGANKDNLEEQKSATSPSHRTVVYEGCHDVVVTRAREFVTQRAISFRLTSNEQLSRWATRTQGKFTPWNLCFLVVLLTSGGSLALWTWE